MTWRAYRENLNEKLKDLHGRIHRGSYRARPAKRSYIPKADGSQRPLAILCLEDKIVQQAVVFVLEAIPAFAGTSLRGRFSRLFLQIPAGARPARCAGCPPCRSLAEESELGARRRYSGLLFRNEPRLDPAFSRAPYRGQAHFAPHCEMVESRNHHTRGLHRTQHARGNRFANFSERLLATTCSICGLIAGASKRHPAMW